MANECGSRLIKNTEGETVKLSDIKIATKYTNPNILQNFIHCPNLKKKRLFSPSFNASKSPKL